MYINNNELVRFKYLMATSISTASYGALGHVPPLNFQQSVFFQFIFKLHKV